MASDEEYEWVVYEGTPSWHQARAGRTSAAETTGFKTEAEAREYVERLKKHHPDMYVRVGRRKKRPSSGFRGTPSAHEAAFRQLVREAKRPWVHGCRQCLIYLGAAYAEMSYFKPKAEHRSALTEASKLLNERCRVKHDPR